MTERTVNLGSLAPGVNNRLEPTKLATTLPDRTQGTYLYGADNVDITADGFVKRRRGQTNVLAGDAHSLWADERGAYAVINGALTALSFNAAGTAATTATLRSGLTSIPLSYSRGADGDVYWTNGSMLRRIADGADRPVVTEQPNPYPGVSIGSGALPQGKYLIAFTASGVDGESPATSVLEADLPAGSSVSWTSTFAVNLYMSAPNGDVLTLQAAGATGSVSTWNETGRRCATLNRAVMPPGQIVRHYRGQLLVASNNILYVSEPYYFGLFNPSRGYIPLPEAITVVEPTDNGLYICADKTYWINDLFGGDLQEMLPYGGILGTSGRHADSETVYWNSPRGLVVADKNASIKAVQEDKLDFAGAARGASLYREQDGMVHVVASRTGASVPSASASSYMEARVIQKGTIL